MRTKRKRCKQGVHLVSLEDVKSEVEMVPTALSCQNCYKPVWEYGACPQSPELQALVDQIVARGDGLAQMGMAFGI